MRGHYPAQLSEWSDDNVIHYLFTQSLNLPGNLVFGEAAWDREQEQRSLRPSGPVDKVNEYIALAEQSEGMVSAGHVGGEQQKFLWSDEGKRHVIVKFARAGSRMSDLLPLEHLDLRTLEKFGVPAASTQLLFAGGYVFLEIDRFDRVGVTGRKGLLSAAAIDDEYFGMRSSWIDFAERGLREGYLEQTDLDFVHTLAAFSELIGNKDRHLENISVLIDDEGSFAGMAPAYDILPMYYAAQSGRCDPDLIPISPTALKGIPPKIWALASQAAESFWIAVENEELAAPISTGFRNLARNNHHLIQYIARVF